MLPSCQGTSSTCCCHRWLLILIQLTDIRTQLSQPCTVNGSPEPLWNPAGLQLQTGTAEAFGFVKWTAPGFSTSPVCRWRLEYPDHTMWLTVIISPSASILPIGSAPSGSPVHQLNHLPTLHAVYSFRKGFSYLRYSVNTRTCIYSCGCVSINRLGN